MCLRRYHRQLPQLRNQDPSAADRAPREPEWFAQIVGEEPEKPRAPPQPRALRPAQLEVPRERATDRIFRGPKPAFCPRRNHPPQSGWPDPDESDARIQIG